MRYQDFSNSDDALEYAASLIEETDISDLHGVWAKRKRDQEDAELRMKTSEEVRRRCAAHIRAMKNRPDLTPLSTLRMIAETKEGYGGHVSYLHDAWPLAWKGWINIECTIKVNSNGIPPETTYRITLTDKGRELLTAD
jgi:hypothetical protein